MVAVPVNKSVPAKKPRVTTYLEDEAYRNLELLANQEKRSISQMAALLLSEAIQIRLSSPQ